MTSDDGQLKIDNNMSYEKIHQINKSNFDSHKGF